MGEEERQPRQTFSSTEERELIAVGPLGLYAVGYVRALDLRRREERKSARRFWIRFGYFVIIYGILVALGASYFLGLL